MSNPILDKTLKFSLEIIAFTELLSEQNKKVVANQLLKSGTSIGANIWEAQNAESRADFIHKMKIAAKEAKETEYWLILCNEAPSYPNCDSVLLMLKEIIKIINKIIFSSKNN